MSVWVPGLLVGRDVKCVCIFARRGIWRAGTLGRSGY